MNNPSLCPQTMALIEHYLRAAVKHHMVSFMDPEDLRQELTLYVLEALADFQGPAADWLNDCHTVLKNALKQIRTSHATERIERFHLSLEDVREEDLPLDEVLHKGLHHPEVVQAMEDERLAGIINLLPSHDRALAKLLTVFSKEEVRQQTNLSEYALGYRLRRMGAVLKEKRPELAAGRRHRRTGRKAFDALLLGPETDAQNTTSSATNILGLFDPAAASAEPNPNQPDPRPSTSAPVASTQKPFSMLSEPVGPTKKPFSMLSEPVASTQKPSSTLSEPVASTQKPSSMLSEPVDPIKNPVPMRPRPVDPINNPVLAFPKHLVLIQKPVPKPSRPVAPTREPRQKPSEPLATLTTTAKPVQTPNAVPVAAPVSGPPQQTPPQPQPEHGPAAPELVHVLA